MPKEHRDSEGSPPRGAVTHRRDAGWVSSGGAAPLGQGSCGRRFVEDCLPWEGAHTGAGEECEESSPEEGAAGLTSVLIPCATGGEEGEKSGAKLSPGRMEGWGEGVFKMWLYFLLSYSDWKINWWWCLT